MRRDRNPGGSSLYARGPRRSRDPGSLWTPQLTNLDYGATQSFLFNGTDETIDFNNPAILGRDWDDALTLSAWFKADAAATGFEAIVCKKSGSTQGYGLHLDSSEQIYADKRQLTDPQSIRGTLALNDDTWHHALVATDGSGTSAGMELYLDGVRLTGGNVVRSGDCNSNITTSHDYRIAARGNSPATFFTGHICHVSAWSTKLSEAEATLVYGSGVPQKLDKLASWASILHWVALDGTDDPESASGILDKSGNANHGTAENMTIASNIVSDAP